ncbi:unnamed protein product [Tetraodon nigroviridis]|uniref:DBIRD complex subunit ZNF326 n=1 Tax=Tetraodon nigroviridis TaxID=99883 RepID=Q4SSL2_TETNG|nr:unnamed protein product [Tetraodon nigroviridis]
MKRNNKVPFYPSAVLRRAAPYLQPESNQLNVARVPHGFKEAMERVKMKSNQYQNMETPAESTKVPAVQPSAVKSSAPKWKSSFKPIDDPDDSLQDRCSDSPERPEIYDPYDPVSPDSEHEISRNQDHSGSMFTEDDNSKPLSVKTSKSRWDIPAPDRDDRDPEDGPSNSGALGLGRRPPEPFVSAGYDSVSRSLDHRAGSPDRHALGLSNQNPASYRPPRTNESERIFPDYRGEVTATGRPSPPGLKRNAQEFGYFPPSMDEIPSRSKRLVMERIPVICDLCDVELLDFQELQDHLDSRTHWNTMEHIQQENNYDDLIIAFLQEVMLHKSRRFSRPIEDSVLEALQENDHMTKVEVFHCAVCESFISSSSSSVRAHVTSQEHLTNTKRFEALQRRGCLDRAQAMMEELKPQFQHFLKVI